MSKSVEELLRQKFAKIRKTKGRNGLELRICCPFCPDRDTKFKMYVNPQKEVFNCYKCNKGGSLRQLLGEIYSPGMRNTVPAPIKEEPLPEDIRSPGFTVPIDALDPLNPAIVYLTRTRKRPFDVAELARDYGVRYCVQGEKFFAGDSMFDTSNTLIFPVWMFGRVIGWQSRLLYDPDKMNDDQCAALGFTKDEDGDWNRPPKYLTSPGFRKGRVLYNFDTARKFPYVVVTEGVFDAMSTGLPAVASFGTGISESQCRLLKTYWETVIIALDPEGTDKQTEYLFNELHRAVEVIHVKLDSYHDPGDAPRAEIWRQVSAVAEHARKTHNAVLQDGFRYREQTIDSTRIKQLWRFQT